MEGYDRQIWNEPSALLQSKIQKQIPIKSWTLVITGHQCKIKVVSTVAYRGLGHHSRCADYRTSTIHDLYIVSSYRL